jgi:tetratricopeptide (TPR) repeat protein
VHAAASPNDLARQGDRALGLGNTRDAVAFYRAALVDDAARPDTWYNLGWALRATRQFDAALAAYGEALRHGSDHPEHLHLNRAAILADHLYQPDAAEEELDTALRLAPGFVPAMLNLGTLHEDRGQADAARDVYRRALLHDPGNGRAHARIGMIDLAEGQVSRSLIALRAAAIQAATPADRAEILYATATALDADESFDAAFDTLTAANRLAAAGAHVRYDAAAHESLVTRLISATHFPLTIPRTETPTPLEPIFVVGMFRSGSTLVEQLFARHSSIIAGGELEYLPALAASDLAPYPESIQNIDRTDILQFRMGYLEELARVAPSGWVTDKRCDNVLHLGLINMLFPDAPIIHTIRHPLDTLISILFLHFGEGVVYGHDQRDAAHYYIQYRRLMGHWRTLFANQIIDVDYDRVVRGPRAEIEPVLGRLGLDWHDVPGASITRPVRTASSWQVRKAVHGRSSGRWQQYARQLEPARQMLADAALL